MSTIQLLRAAALAVLAVLWLVTLPAVFGSTGAAAVDWPGRVLGVLAGVSLHLFAPPAAHTPALQLGRLSPLDPMLDELLQHGRLSLWRPASLLTNLLNLYIAFVLVPLALYFMVMMLRNFAVYTWQHGVPSVPAAAAAAGAPSPEPYSQECHAAVAALGGVGDALAALDRTELTQQVEAAAAAGLAELLARVPAAAPFFNGAAAALAPLQAGAVSGTLQSLVGWTVKWFMLLFMAPGMVFCLTGGELVQALFASPFAANSSESDLAGLFHVLPWRSFAMMVALWPLAGAGNAYLNWRVRRYCHAALEAAAARAPDAATPSGRTVLAPVALIGDAEVDAELRVLAANCEASQVAYDAFMGDLAHWEHTAEARITPLARVRSSAAVATQTS